MKTPVIDTWKVEEHLVSFIRRAVERSGKEKAVVGLSGGIDSATIGALAVRAMGSSNVIGLLLPYRAGRPEDIRDAQELADLFGIHTRTIDIAPMIDAYFEHFSRASVMRKGNKMARERMSILYDWASYHNALVLGTGNRTEYYMGYFTKYGDGGVDVEPIGCLYKTEVRQLAVSIGIPRHLANRTPTAGLWQGQTDEGELGFTYQFLDSILYCMIDLHLGRQSLLQEGFFPDDIDTVRSMVRATRHKRRTPPIPEFKAEWRKAEEE
ncbi:MAG TPA: NAD+ synthase [bacterium]|nr:NAD+ synthase [bacterium]HPQ66461.1 NAD+ synthase [bacterium]